MPPLFSRFLDANAADQKGQPLGCQVQWTLWSRCLSLRSNQDQSHCVATMWAQRFLFYCSSLFSIAFHLSEFRFVWCFYFKCHFFFQVLKGLCFPEFQIFMQKQEPIWQRLLHQLLQLLVPAPWDSCRDLTHFSVSNDVGAKMEQKKMPKDATIHSGNCMESTCQRPQGLCPGGSATQSDWTRLINFKPGVCVS